MRLHIASMRERLHSVLTSAAPGRDFDYIVKQRGMFAYTGLSSAQVAPLQSDFGVFAVSSGRICVAGLNHSNVDYVAEAFARVIR
nr:aminotransferase class I/II-fold pyridoxal phosphate-dependent enzyme [Paraburkholderia sp. BCC1886]